MKTKTLAIVLAAAFTFGSVGFGTGCRKKGPVERAGEKIDDAAQKAKDTIDPPGPAEKAGRKVDRAIGND
jgi:hypothetical protein